MQMCCEQQGNSKVTLKPRGQTATVYESVCVWERERGRERMGVWLPQVIRKYLILKWTHIELWWNELNTHSRVMWRWWYFNSLYISEVIIQEYLNQFLCCCFMNDKKGILHLQDILSLLGCPLALSFFSFRRKIFTKLIISSDHSPQWKNY